MSFFHIPPPPTATKTCFVVPSVLKKKKTAKKKRSGRGSRAGEGTDGRKKKAPDSRGRKKQKVTVKKTEAGKYRKRFRRNKTDG